MIKLYASLSLALLFSGCSPLPVDDDLQIAQLVKSNSSWDGASLPVYGRGVPEVTILRILIPPGYALPMHKHPVINAGILLRGELTVITEKGDVLHLQADDPIVEVVGQWHYGRNEGDVPAEIVVFYAGEEGVPLTVKKGDGQPSSATQSANQPVGQYPD